MRACGARWPRLRRGIFYYLPPAWLISRTGRWDGLDVRRKGRRRRARGGRALTMGEGTFSRMLGIRMEVLLPCLSVIAAGTDACFFIQNGWR